MGLYGNKFNNEELLDESFIDKETMEVIKNWKTRNENHRKSVFKSTSLSDEEYNKLKDIVDTLKKEDVEYAEYKKAFDKLCYFIRIVPRGVIITKCNLKKGSSDNNNELYVEYSSNNKKIKLPEGTKLYHLSKIGGIKQLIPQFKGKSERGYLYDKPRIYFTIRKSMPKFLADYKLTDKMHKYECKENITDVYVDPLVWTNAQGAVYVEVNKPITVEEKGIKKEGNSKENDNKESDDNSKEESKNESSIDFDLLLNFVTEFGLTINEEEN